MRAGHCPAKSRAVHLAARCTLLPACTASHGDSPASTRPPGAFQRSTSGRWHSKTSSRSFKVVARQPACMTSTVRPALYEGGWVVIHEGPHGVKGVLVTGLGGFGAGRLTAFRLGKVLQSSIRSRWADQSVVRCSGAQSSGRPSSGFSEAMTNVELARACASCRRRGRNPCCVSARRGSCRQLLFRVRAAAARQATDLSVA